MADNSMYEEMGKDMGDSMDEEPPASERTEPGGKEDLDEAFRLHAEAAGFDTPEKAEALKMAIERCVELREENAYAPAKDEGDETDEDAEI